MYNYGMYEGIKYCNVQRARTNCKTKTKSTCKRHEKLQNRHMLYTRNKDKRWNRQEY